MTDFIIFIYTGVQEWLMQHVVLPVLYASGGMGYAEDAVSGLDWFVLGLIQIAVIALIFGPLEKMFPVEAHPHHPEAKRKMRRRRRSIFFTPCSIGSAFLN